MIELDFAALRATPAASEPFPHVVIPNFVPPDSLALVVAALPQIGNGGSYPPGSLRLGYYTDDHYASFRKIVQ